MAQAPFTAGIVGATGLVGSQILSTLLHLTPAVPTDAFARRALTATPATAPLTAHIDPATDAWPAALERLRPADPQRAAFFSGLGTTRAAAGGVAQQRALDVDFAAAMARAARTAGYTTYVLVSSSGANAGSRFAYMQMKGELEETVKGLGFRHVVILRPGLLVGDRAKAHGLAEGGLRMLATGLGKTLGTAATDWWAQDVEVVGRAAVAAARECVEGRRKEEGAWVLEQADIVRLGRKEWAP